MRSIKKIIAIGICSFLFAAQAQALTGPPHERKMRRALINMSCLLAEKHEISYLLEGLGGVAGTLADDTRFGVVWTCRKKLTLDQARLLMGLVAKEMLDQLQGEPHYMNYYKERHIHDLKRQYSPMKIDPEKIALMEQRMGLLDFAFKISFWDEQMDRPLNPYIADVRLIEGKIYYYYADPKTQALLDPIIEPFDYVWGPKVKPS